MSLLGRVTKQPNEILDYDVDFGDWFALRTDTPVDHYAEIDTGADLVETLRQGNIVKVVVGGGTDGENYKVTVRVTTSTDIVREVDFVVAVREI